MGLILYTIATVFAVTVVIISAMALKDDCHLSTTSGNFGIAFVAAAGFCVFPVLNVPTAFWLLCELESAKAESKKRKERLKSLGF